MRANHGTRTTRQGAVSADTMVVTGTWTADSAAKLLRYGLESRSSDAAHRLEPPLSTTSANDDVLAVVAISMSFLMKHFNHLLFHSLLLFLYVLGI